ncbi:MAG: AraC family transcriptional regulator [Cyanobacteria bacterium P01_F01_bin.150]
MTIELTIDEFFRQMQETDDEELRWGLPDQQIATYQFNPRFSQGWRREICLREGLWLHIDRHQPVDRLILQNLDQKLNHIHCSFTLSGKGRVFNASNPDRAEVLQIAGKYYLESNGMGSKSTADYLAVEPCSFLEIAMRPDILRSFVALQGDLPEHLQHLIRHPNELNYDREGEIQPSMANVLQQILLCPHQGMIKRMYLESKVIELMALVLDHEALIQKGTEEKAQLKPDQVERIHYAKEILLQDLNDPPSLTELAHQAGLNDFLLKHGFRQVFGKTVFGELRSHRLGLAKQQLAQQNVSVTEVAMQVGYGSGTAFARSFRREFGISPKAYQKACR